MNEVPKKSGKYGFLDGKTANGLYKEYKRYCAEKNTECMPFQKWLVWAQDRGMVQKLSADAGGLGSAQFQQLALTLTDDGINRLYLEMSKAKTENWDSEKLKSIAQMSPVASGMSLGITDQKILGVAMTAFQDEMQRRGLPIPSNPAPGPPLMPRPANPWKTKWIVPTLLVVGGLGLVYMAVKKS